MYILATDSCEFITNKYYHNNILINYRISKIINTSGKKYNRKYYKNINYIETVQIIYCHDVSSDSISTNYIQ